MFAEGLHRRGRRVGRVRRFGAAFVGVRFGAVFVDVRVGRRVFPSVASD
jgi:hypothetical protein